MASSLECSVRKHFLERGFAGPFRLYSAEEMHKLTRQIDRDVECTKQQYPDGIRSLLRYRNRHSDLPAVRQICLHERIKLNIRSILGNTGMLWRSQIVEFARGSCAFPWHLDCYPSLLRDTNDGLTVHLALTDGFEHNCFALIPGSQQLNRREVERYCGLNIHAKDSYGNPVLKKNADLELASQQLALRKIVLSSGEYILFHPKLLHRSWVEPCSSGDCKRRVLVVRVVSESNDVYERAFKETPFLDNQLLSFEAVSDEY